MTEKRAFHTIAGKFLITLIAAALLGSGIFCLLWSQKAAIYLFLFRHDIIRHERAAMIENFKDEAADIIIEPADDIKGMYYGSPESVELIERRDDYSGIIIYDETEEEYLYAYYPKIINDWRYRIGHSTEWESKIDDYTTIKEYVRFRDQVVTVYFISYHFYAFIPWYLGCSVIAGIVIFLIPLFWYLQRKAKEINRLKEEVLYMAEGGLERTIRSSSQDEIGILAEQMDMLRSTLDENIRREQAGKQANGELIRAISHDLRTPLTILSGYLEILKHGKGDPDKQEDYLDHCIRKVQEVSSLSDKMFEYALIYEVDEVLNVTEVPVKELLDHLIGHIQFLRLSGYQVRENISECSGQIKGSKEALQRVFNNLFSNILRYGNKRKVVTVCCQMEDGKFHLQINNYIKTEQNKTESSEIGIRSVEKIIGLHGGTFTYSEQGEQFFVQVVL